MNKSHTEEIIAILTLIAALLSWHIGWEILAYFLFAKSVLDFSCSAGYAIKEIADREHEKL